MERPNEQQQRLSRWAINHSSPAPSPLLHETKRNATFKKKRGPGRSSWNPKEVARLGEFWHKLTRRRGGRLAELAPNPIFRRSRGLQGCNTLEPTSLGGGTRWSLRRMVMMTMTMMMMMMMMTMTMMMVMMRTMTMTMTMTKMMMMTTGGGARSLWPAQKSSSGLFHLLIKAFVGLRTFDCKVNHGLKQSFHTKPDSKYLSN